METLAPEHRPIVERLAAGGVPAVRKAVADEQERARAEGRPSLSGEAIVALAEGLLPDVKAALWLDRAEAAAAHLDQLSLRDLRATVVTATARDDSGRELARASSGRRWTTGSPSCAATGSSDSNKPSPADGYCRLCGCRRSRLEPTARFPAALIERLATQAGAAMRADLSPDRWLALLDAAAACPVRRQIKPAGIPDDPSGEVARSGKVGRRTNPRSGADARHDDAASPATSRRRPPGAATPATRRPGPARPAADSPAVPAPAETPVGPGEGAQAAMPVPPEAPVGVGEGAQAAVPAPPVPNPSEPDASDPAAESDPVTGEDPVVGQPLSETVDQR